MSERERRQGLNEAVFRQVNERINDVHEAFELDPQKLHLMCECGDPTCLAAVEVTHAEYEAVRAYGSHFLIEPNHENPESSWVLCENERFAVVGRPRESSVEVSLGKVPLDKLMRLLQSIERSPGVVRVRRLRLRKSQESKDTLDVTLTVSAWQSA